MKKNYTLTKLMIAITAAAALCACEKPAAPLETSVEVVEETVVEDPAPVVEEPEIDEPETTEPEVIKEESNEPELVLYDDNGDFYVPQKVTLDEFNARIDYANGKYNWKSDWDRDRYVGLLLYNNAYAMEDSDIKEVYDDYLDNFGIDILEGQSNVFMDHDEEYINDPYFKYHTYIDFEDYYIDAKLASEAKKFQPCLTDDSRKTVVEFKNKKEDFIESLDYTNKDMYNIVFENEMSYIVAGFSEDVVNGFADNSYIRSESKQKVWDQINLEGEMMGDYQVSKYVSSHQE